MFAVQVGLLPGLLLESWGLLLALVVGVVVVLAVVAARRRKKDRTTADMMTYPPSTPYGAPTAGAVAGYCGAWGAPMGPGAYACSVCGTLLGASAPPAQGPPPGYAGPSPGYHGPPGDPPQ